MGSERKVEHTLRVVIESGVKMPARANLGRWREVLSLMKLGDSFLLRSRDEYPTVFLQARRMGVKVSSRREANAIRVWRVK